MQRGKAIGALNGLKDRGVISDFKTGLFGSDAAGPVPEVTVTVTDDLDPAGMQAVAERVSRELEPFVGEIGVTVLRDPNSKSGR